MCVCLQPCLGLHDLLSSSPAAPAHITAKHLLQPASAHSTNPTFPCAAWLLSLLSAALAITTVSPLLQPASAQILQWIHGLRNSTPSTPWTLATQTGAAAATTRRWCQGPPGVCCCQRLTLQSLCICWGSCVWQWPACASRGCGMQAAGSDHLLARRCGGFAQQSVCDARGWVAPML
jgi:hypothetical protein